MINTNNLSNIANSILDNYSQNLDSLPYAMQKHFIDRVYVITGKVLNKELIQKDIESSKVLFQKFIDNDFVIEKFSLREYQKQDNNQSMRFKRRVDFYNSNPATYRDSEILRLFYRIYKASNDQNFYNENKSVVEKILNENRITDYEFFLADPVKVLNVTFASKNIDLTDRTETVVEFMKKVEINSEFNLFDYYYGITHVIIGLSNFYQNIISESDYQKYEWFFDKLQENLDTILEKTNIDISIETGLCFKLALKPNNHLFDRIEGIIKDKFDPKLNLITEGESTSLVDLEHANILAIMFILFENNLYKLPII